jgi:hypothetical protein
LNRLGRPRGPKMVSCSRGEPYWGYKLSEATAGRRRSAPSFRPDQIEAMNRAFRQACSRLELTGPVVELVAIRILELVRDGESDPDRLTEATVSTFEG